MANDCEARCAEMSLALQGAQALLNWLDRRGGLGLDVHTYIDSVRMQIGTALCLVHEERLPPPSPAYGGWVVKDGQWVRP